MPAEEVEAGEVAADPGAGVPCAFEASVFFFVFLLLLGVLESLWF